MTTDDASSAPDWPPPPPTRWAEDEPVHHPKGAPAALALLASICVLVYGLFFSAVDPVLAAVDYDPVPPLSLFLHLSFAFYATPFAIYGAFALVPGAVQPWVTAGVAIPAALLTQTLLWDALLLRVLPELSTFVLAALALQLASLVLALVAQWRYEERARSASA